MQTINAPRTFALDRTRIASLSGAIAVNGLVLLLLLVPMVPPVIQSTDRVTIVEPIPPKPREVKPPEPKPVEKEKPTVVPVTTATRRQKTKVDDPPQAVVADSQPGDVLATTGDAVIPQDEVLPPDDGKPMTGAQLQYASAPAPTYPRESLVAGETGVVMLQVLVDVDGRPIEVTISRSSGYRRLDVAAKRQVLSKWRFHPAMRNGQAVQAIGIVPVEFTLD